MQKSPMFTARTIKRFTSVHSWIGIVTGMALFIAFFAGALTMYAEPMHQWANPGLRHASGSMAHLDTLVANVAAEPAARGRFTVSFEDGGTPTASFFERGKGRSFTMHDRAFDDDLEIVARQSGSRVEDFINYIHYTIGLPKHPGYVFMGVISALYFLALVTGLIIHLPHLLRDLYALRVSRNLKKMWLDAHNAIGILSLPFHLMFAFTAFLICLLFLFPDAMEQVTPTDAPSAAYRETGFYGNRGGGERSGRRDAVPPAAATPMSPAQILSIANGRLKGFEPTSIDYADYGTTAAKATVNGHFRTALISKGSVEISAVTGKVGKVDAPDERLTSRMLEDSYLFLHYGDYGGQVMRALYFALGLGGAFLFYSGNLLWIETRRRRRHADQPMTGWKMAQWTIGICLGSCLGIGVMLAGTRLLPLILSNIGTWEGNLYYLGFFAAVMWSVARPPISAGIELLFACAVVYAALPVLNAMLTPDNLWTAWRAGAWPVALIDAIFAGLAIGFLAIGRATMRRAKTGQPNSVWSLTSRPDIGGARPMVAQAAT